MAESTALTAEQSFQEKMKERIREQIGDLMPDAMLQKMVEEALKDAFQKPVKVTTKKDNYDRTIESMEEPWLRSVVREMLQDSVKEIATKFLADPRNVAEIQTTVISELKATATKVLIGGVLNGIASGMQTGIMNDFIMKFFSDHRHAILNTLQRGY